MLLIVPSSALSVEQLEDFMRFVETAPGLPETVGAAAEMALSIRYALGLPNIGPGPAAVEALAEWLRIHGTPEWRQACMAICKLPVAPVADHLSFTLDDHSGLRGWDQGAWSPVKRVLERLEAWCEVALPAYRATPAPLPAPPPSSSPPPSSPVSDTQERPSEELTSSPTPAHKEARDRFLIETKGRGDREWGPYVTAVMKASKVTLRADGRPPEGFSSDRLRTRLRELKEQGRL